MKLLLDSNVLVAGLFKAHPAHERSSSYLRTCQQGEYTAFMTLHSLAETYAVTSRLPLFPRPKPEAVRQLLEDASTWINFVTLDEEDYWEAINRMATLGLVGGGIYDALHAVAALRLKVDMILTFNDKHFTRLGEDVASIVKVP